MINMAFREVVTETLDILNHMEKAYIEKIPKKFINFLEENKSTTYVSKLNHSNKINEMNLKEGTKNLLATIYLSYWCSPQEKANYAKILNENEKKYQEELRKKYNLDNIFIKRT